jgi:sugar phosphate isomerase/epimerase
MNSIGIDFISVLGQPPGDYVHVVADLGCRKLSIAPTPIVSVEGFYPAWSLVEDAPLRRAVKAALRDRGVAVSQGEGIMVWPDRDMTEFAPEMDAIADLGAPLVNAISIEPDQARMFDQLGIFAEMAAARGLAAMIEYVPTTGLPDLSTALAALAHVGRPDLKLMLDTMHWFRSGATLADLAALDPALIGHVQLCDVPWVSSQEYGDEARYDRLAPGEGELPLAAFIAALPPGQLLGLELPMRAKMLAGMDPLERLRPAVEATQKLVAEDAS